MNPLHGASGTFRLFVYGTLKRGGCRHTPIASQRFLGEAQTTPRYALYDLGNYPGLVMRADTGMVVHGELYEVNCSLVDWLDAMEGSPDWFKLEPIELAQQQGVVWAYFYQGDTGDRQPIASGVWHNQ